MAEVLKKLVVAAESIPNGGTFGGLRSVERDSDIDAVMLAFYWNRPEHGDHP